MKKSDKLKALLKQMIREEVSDQVNKAMGRMLVEILKEHRTSKPIVETTEVEAPVPTRRVPLTGNSALDAVLTETARNYVPLKVGDDEGVSLSQLMGTGFEKIGQTEQAITAPAAPVTKIDFLKQIVSEGAKPVTQTSVVDMPGVPDALKKVFKKDFRSVMKAIDDKRKNGSSGMFAGAVTLEG